MRYMFSVDVLKCHDIDLMHKMLHFRLFLCINILDLFEGQTYRLLALFLRSYRFQKFKTIKMKFIFANNLLLGDRLKGEERS